MLTRARRPSAAPPPAAPPDGDGVRVVALVKGGERFVYLFPGGREPACLAALARHAADPALSLAAADAALLAGRVTGV